MSNEIQVRSTSAGSTGLQLSGWGDMMQFAEAVCSTQLAPRDFKSPQAVAVAIQMGLEVGLAPMQALQSIAVINGRPCIWGDAAKALVLSSGLCEDFQEFFEGEGKALKAVCVVKRKGIASPVRQTFSMEDADRAGLLKKSGPWSDYRKRMLQLRARSWALRDAFPDVLKGLSCGEEVSDYKLPDQRPRNEDGRVIVDSESHDDYAYTPQPASAPASAPARAQQPDTDAAPVAEHYVSRYWRTWCTLKKRRGLEDHILTESIEHLGLSGFKTATEDELDRLIEYVERTTSEAATADPEPATPTAVNNDDVLF